MNLLTDIVPAKARKYVYALYAMAGIVVGALAIAGVDVGKAPDVIAYLGIALGLTAASNTARKPAGIKGSITLGSSGLVAGGGNFTITPLIDPNVETGRQIKAALDAYHRSHGK